MAVLAAIGEGLVELERDGQEERLTLAAGGDASNIVVMAARLGAATRLGGRVGSDPLGTWLRSFWAHHGVDVAHVRIDRNAVTGLYLNTPAGNGEHHFTYWRQGSAGSRLEPGDLDEALFTDLAILVVTGVTLAVSRSSAATLARAVTRAREARARIACVLNHRPALHGDPSALAALARSADVVVGSTEDAAAVFGKRNALSLARDMPDVEELVLTDGGAPAVAVANGVAHRQRVPQMAAVNAAGAGDAFAGAYLARRLAGRAVNDALAWGVAASALSVTRRGCAGSYPTLDEARALAQRLAEMP